MEVAELLHQLGHFSNLVTVDLDNNELFGEVPVSIRELINLKELSLAHNNLHGTIPCSMLQLQQLKFLDLSKNLLDGRLPSCSRGFDTSTITLLKLNNNHILGAFPLFLHKCRELKLLDLAYNKFSGSLPTWIESKLPQLALLNLRSNMFSGGIPSQLTRMKGLQFLDIACNNISGNIPRSLGNLKAMTFTSNNSGGLFDLVNYIVVGGVGKAMSTDAYTVEVEIKGQVLEYTKGIAYMVNLDFSSNSLTGQIPKEIGMLIALKNLNFSWNSLTDIIPQSIGALQALESFDLSHNGLSGEIPTSISSLTSLTRLNLSYNDLTGTIPSGNQLRTLEDQASIYIGNPGLCGQPVPRNCSRSDIIPYAPQEHNEGMSDVVSLYLSMCIGFVVGLWIVFCGFLFKRKWRIGWFSFTDHMYDQAYMHVAVGWASLERNIRQG
uniref:Protein BRASSINOSTEROID INSENSITIVE 1 n=1 Tax=Aegilops tauschii TaxID=37682 RepID=M8BRY7_AEGTA